MDSMAVLAVSRRAPRRTNNDDGMLEREKRLWVSSIMRKDTMKTKVEGTCGRIEARRSFGARAQ
jgi:hypothetical protein